VNPPPPPPIPFAHPAAAAGPQLTPEHFKQIAEARTAAKRVRRAVGVARFDGWTIGLFGGLTLLLSLTSPSGLAIGVGMIAIAAVELWGAARLGRLDPSAPRMLGFNQIAVALLLTAYAAWSMYAVAYGPAATSTMSADERELATMLGPVDELSRQIQYVIYGIVILVAVFGQGSLALYYFSRARHVRAYLEQTPPWIIEMQKAGVVL
jgi:hypothetical protein